MIIRSILDDDMYKFSMQQVVCQLYPRIKTRHKFINRGKTKFPTGFGSELRKEVSAMSNLSLLKEEKEWMGDRVRYFNNVYLDFLSGYRYDPAEVGVIQNGHDLDIDFDGYWYRSILWEVKVMAIVSELYFKMTGEPINDRLTREKNNQAKAKIFYGHNMKLADFGTRRRYSYDNQFEVCSDMKNMFGSEKFFAGTSNVHIAMKLGLTPIGTYAHEFISGIAALQGYAHANKHAMDAWITVYNGDLGIALPDTFGLDAFLKDFDLKYAKLYDGVRHDSGDPFEFIDKIVAHYVKLKIDPLSKVIVFSDGLNTELSLKISQYCSGKIKCSFGIGTNMTNDVGVKPLNIVIKLFEIDGHHAIKLSDNLGKSVGDQETIQYVKWLLGYKEKELATA
jgi:nicotinate phosphoribosyltransferase